VTRRSWRRLTAAARPRRGARLLSEFVLHEPAAGTVEKKTGPGGHAHIPFGQGLTALGTLFGLIHGGRLRGCGLRRSRLGWSRLWRCRLRRSRLRWSRARWKDLGPSATHEDHPVSRVHRAGSNFCKGGHYRRVSDFRRKTGRRRHMVDDICRIRHLVTPFSMCDSRQLLPHLAGPGSAMNMRKRSGISDSVSSICEATFEFNNVHNSPRTKRRHGIACRTGTARRTSRRRFAEGRRLFPPRIGGGCAHMCVCGGSTRLLVSGDKRHSFPVKHDTARSIGCRLPWVPGNGKGVSVGIDRCCCAVSK
jgi:hypothetical protein